MTSLLNKLSRDYPELTFTPASEFCWSPKTKEVLYNSKSTAHTTPWSLLHELGHALLDHRSYQSDLELLQMEAAAWQKARRVGKQYGYEIDEDHIQDCMDTYRDWLHQRSACPRCNTRSLQQDNRQYNCHNCGTTWTVSLSRFCRPYRMTKKAKTPPPVRKATFA